MKRRETRQKEAILMVLRGTRTHPTADRIYDEVRKTIPSISKGTVYRNLKVLREAGEVTGLDIAGTVTRYEARRPDHYHFRCTRCGRVLDVDEPVNAELNLRVAERTGYQVSYHQLEFRGLCGECQQTNK